MRGVMRKEGQENRDHHHSQMNHQKGDIRNITTNTRNTNMDNQSTVTEMAKLVAVF